MYTWSMPGQPSAMDRQPQEQPGQSPPRPSSSPAIPPPPQPDWAQVLRICFPYTLGSPLRSRAARKSPCGPWPQPQPPGSGCPSVHLSSRVRGLHRWGLAHMKSSPLQTSRLLRVPRSKALGPLCLHPSGPTSRKRCVPIRLPGPQGRDRGCPDIVSLGDPSPPCPAQTPGKLLHR